MHIAMKNIGVLKIIILKIPISVAVKMEIGWILWVLIEVMRCSDEGSDEG